MKKQEIIIVKRAEWEDVPNPGSNSIEFDGIKNKFVRAIKRSR
jgi:hypothetical protein